MTTAATTRSGDAVLVAEGLTKVYPGSRALDGASFTARRNEIHTVVGSNGAGKSTLVKVIGGRAHPDKGTLHIAGEQVDHSKKNYLEAYSIGYVSQEGSLDLESTAYENIFLGRERSRRGLVSYRTMQREAQELAEKYEFDIDLKQAVSALSPSERKIVEILRALAVAPRLLILDEPTAALPKPDIDHLLSIMRTLSRSTSIIFISHYMNEIFGVSDRITVMRDGCRVSERLVTETNPDQLVAEMLGERALRQRSEPTRSAPVTTSPRTGPALLEAKAIRTRDGRVVEGNLTVRAGEVVGLFGMVGAGKSEFLEALYGMRKVQSGSLASEARQVDLKRWSVRQALSCGLALVPEDRLKNALVATESGAWNLAAPHWRRNRGLRSRLGSMEKSLADQAGNLVTIKGDVAGQPVSNLSGGNKQKVSVARWLVAGDPPSVLLLDEPTQGLDVVARQEIYDLIRKLAQGGTAVLLASSDLEEAVTVTDRLYIMRAGHALEFSEQDRTRDRVLLAATSENENSRRTHA